MRASTTTPGPAGGEYEVRTPVSASTSPTPAGSRSFLAALARNLDVVIVLVGAAPALALGAPALGYVIAAAAWVGQRLLAHFDRGLIARRREPGSQAGVQLFEAFGRIWLLAGAIVAAGVAGGRADGLTAAVTIFVAYSIAFGLRVISGRPLGGAAR